MIPQPAAAAPGALVDAQWIPQAAAASPGARADTQFIARAAIVSLYEELALYPKPGLVSFVDSGSHADMDGATFLRSLFALRHDFARIARLGAAGAGFDALEQAGIEAESRMLRATGGVNTHRGAIFTLGLVCAAAGSLQAAGRRPVATALRSALATAWGGDLRRRQRVAQPRAAGLRDAGSEAAAGFPVLFEVAVPTLAGELARGRPRQLALLQTLFRVLAGLDDTNLVRRGGIEGLRHVQEAARGFLAAGGAAHPDAIARATALHRDFVARHLSPGGAADMLAAACWVLRMERAR